MKNGRITIKVVGVGGGGGNAINHIAATNGYHEGEMVSFTTINTDAQALQLINGPATLQIGQNLTNGYGSGGRPEIGKQAAEEDYDTIQQLFVDTDLVLITAGLGGGTGTGASPVIAKAAREMGALTMAIVTKPFFFEGTRRKETAVDGLNELRQIVDTVICIPNDRILKVSDNNMPIEQAFRMTDDILDKVVRAVNTLVGNVGIINIDYGDIASVIREPGEAMVGFGEATGESHASKATRYAMASPLLERNDIIGAKQVLISIVGGRDMSMKDVQEAVQCIHNEVRGEANVVFGVITSDELNDTAHVTVIATGLPDVKKADKLKPKISSIPLQQKTFDFLPAETGRFVGIEPTLLNGVNYDTPTYIRWGRKLLSDAA